MNFSNFQRREFHPADRSVNVAAKLGRRANFFGGAFIFALLTFGSLPVSAATPPAPPEDLISPAHAIDPANVPAPWTEILAKLQKKGNIHSTFTENRYLPFKKIPVVFTGELRLSAEHGLSLHYSTPEDRRMTIDSHGVLLRDAAGHTREAPPDPRALAATTALLDVMRFDFSALAQHFRTYAAGDAQTWYFGFEPKDDDVGHALSRLIVSGQNDEVRRIVIRKSALASVEIVIGEVKAGVTFTPEELQRFFR